MSQIFIGSLPKAAPRVAVIMAGGSGTRFWPLSRTNRPKQFLPLAGGAQDTHALNSQPMSLLQATSARMAPLCSEQAVLVVTAGHQSPLVCEQLPEAAVLCEPSARNTAACIGYAAAKVLAEVGDVPMMCLPADHIVHGQDEITAVYRDACELAAADDVLVTIGIRPTAPETGYGYIKRSDSVTPLKSGSAAYKVECFVEKPDRATAEQYLVSGEYFWNSGMFVWRPSVILAALEEFLPEQHAILERIAACFGTDDEYSKIAELYSTIEKVSIDVGVMEQAQNVLMLPGETFSWSDVGSWSAWSESKMEAADASGNIVEGDAILIGSKNTTVVSEERLIAAVGVEDLIVVDTPDAVLVCHRERSQEVKDVVEALRKNGRNDLL